MSGLVAASSVAGTVHGTFVNLGFGQATDSATGGDLHLLTIFVGIAAFSLLILVLMVVGAAIAALIAVNKVSAQVKAVRAQVMAKATPLIDKGQGLVEKAQTLMVDLTPEIKKITTQVHGIVEKSQLLITDLTPDIKQITSKVTEISGHAAEIAGVAKDKVNEFAPTVTAINGTVQEANETVRLVNQKAREQVERVDVLVTDALESTRSMGNTFSEAVTKPARDVAGIVNNAKEAVNSAVGTAKSSVDSVLKGTKSSVDSISSSTKSFVDSLVHGAKGVGASFFNSKPKTAKSYPRASYVSDPAVPNIPVHDAGAEQKEVDNYSTL